MKKTIRNITLSVVGLLLTAFPAVAATWNVDLHAGYWNGAWIPYADTSTGVSAPSGAGVGWYAYSYAGSGSWARVYATAPGVYIDQTVYSNSNSGQQNLSAAGYVTVYLESAAYGGGGTGCGVTVGW